MYLFWLLKDAEYRRDGATLNQHFHNSSDRKQEETTAMFQGCGLCLTHYRIDRGAGGTKFLAGVDWRRLPKQATRILWRKAHAPNPHFFTFSSESGSCGWMFRSRVCSAERPQRFIERPGSTQGSPGRLFAGQLEETEAERPDTGQQHPGGAHENGGQNG